MLNSNEEFYIKKVIVNNFRGYKGKETFSFEKDGKISKLILLTGANGYGKTSLIDAIEWGFTGKISRLIKYLDNRVHSSDKDNKKNNDGLIVNINAEEKITEVEIYVLYKGKDILIKRTFGGNLQENEVIKGKGSVFSIDCNDKEIKKEIKVKLSNFDNDNICSYDKNIDLYNKGRKDIYEIFSTLYSDKHKINNIIKNLDESKKYLNNKKIALNSEIDDIKEKIEYSKTLKENYSKNIIDTIYPKDNIYAGEIILDDENINKVNLDDIRNQIKILSNIRNIELLTEISNIVNITRENIKFEKQKELLNILKIKDNIFKRLINSNFIHIKDEITELENIKKYVNNIKSYENIVSKVEYKDKIISMVGDNNISNIMNVRSNIEDLNKELSLYSEENPTVKVLRYIVDHTKELKEYQSSHIDCPICGNKDTFKDAEVGNIAKKILGENDIERQNIKSKIRDLKDKEYNEIIKFKESVAKYVDEKILNLNNDLKEKRYIDDIKNLLKDLNMNYNDNLILTLEEQINKNSIKKIKSEREIISYIYSKDYSFLSDLTDKLNSENYINLSLDNKIKILSTIISRISINIFEINEYSKTDINQLDNRIALCNSYINKLKNNKLLEDINLLNKKKLSKIEDLNLIEKKITTVTSMISKVKKIKTEDEKKQTELIQKPLDSIYRKITRNTNIKKIALTKAKADGSSELDIVDFNNKKTSFANILSAGQLSTLAISIFLAKASLNYENNIKLYLMDEPIQTMDDLNILSFIDLMKYQVVKNSNHSFIDQVIFSTCDDNLSRLFTYKFESFNIPVCEYKFEGHSKAIKI